MTERTNEQWLADLQQDGPVRSAALADLAARLRRGLTFYLMNDRSDLSTRSVEEIQQMAQDFAQEALLRVLDNLGSFRGESLFVTWAAKIAARVAISELRRARYRDYSLEQVSVEGEVLPGIAAVAGVGGGPAQPERQTERQDALARIDSAIQQSLTERQRHALLALAIEGVPVEEVAARMNTNRNALYKLLHDARLKLKQHLESQGLSMEYLLELFESS